MEYAKEYTKSEKILRLSLITCMGTILIVIHKILIWPLITDIVDNPHCYQILGYSAKDYFWHWIFIAIPSPALIIASVVLLPIGFKGIKEGCFPPGSVKVYRPTLVTTGATAYFKSAVHTLLPILILVLLILGYHQVENMPPINNQNLDINSCLERGQRT